MKNVKNWVLIFLLMILIGLSAVFFFQQTFSPMEDGLQLEYATTLFSVKPQVVSEQKIRFSKIDGKYYQADIVSTGFLENQQSYIVDKYFLDKEDRALSGPTAAVLWTAPYLLRIGNNVAAGEVIKFTQWYGYSAAVIQDQALSNCYGFYDRKTGIQIGYMNSFSVNKMLTIINQKNIKGLD